MDSIRKCACGSGDIRFPLYDGKGIFMTYACSQCEDSKISEFRSDIMEDYDCDEQVDEDY